MSAKAPPLMLISSTIPSKPTEGVTPLDSMLKRFWKLTVPPPAGTAKLGVTSSVLPTVETSGANASLGALAGVVVEVTQSDSEPVAAVVHPAGNAGATTPSKFCVKNGAPPHGEGVGEAVGDGDTDGVGEADGVAVGVTVALGVGLAVGLALGVGLTLGVGVGEAAMRSSAPISGWASRV